MEKYHFLCVDDSKAVHAFLKDCLQSVALSITIAMDGQEAIEIIMKNKTQFDLIFLDWEMPRMTGPETLRRYQKWELAHPLSCLLRKVIPLISL
jgi:CheY-like chemotaxis protein